MAKLFSIQVILLPSTVLLFIGILIQKLHAQLSAVEQNDFQSSNFAEMFELRQVALSNVNLLSTQNTRSKLQCATFCDLEEKCKMFRFEAPSASCHLYREVTTGGCFGFTSRNVSNYYTHLGRVSTWLMLFFAPHDKKLFIWKEKNNSWEETSLPYQMKSARIDSMTWRLYWGPYEPNRGIHSSDVRGNNEMTIVPSVSSRSLDIDPVHRRLFHDGGLEDFVGMVDLDNNNASVFERGDGQAGLIKDVHLLPELRFVFWIDNFELWRRHYDESKAHKIPAYTGGYEAYTTDHLYNRLIWTQLGTTVLLFTDAWGEDQTHVALSGLMMMPSLPTVFTMNGNICIIGCYPLTVKVFNCRGEFTNNLTVVQTFASSDRKNLVWIPEQVYYNL